MVEMDKITKLVYDAIDEINKENSKKQKITKSLDTVLYGGQNNLDSLGLVNLIVNIEEKIEDNLGITIDLTDDKAMSQKRSPFRTIGTLVDYITKKSREN